MSEQERKAVDRVRDAGIDAPEYVILAWVRCAKPQNILAGSLDEIRSVAWTF